MEKLPEDFSSVDYLFLHPDVEAAGVDPAEHYLYYGKNEGRRYTWNKVPAKELLPNEPGFQPIPIVVISFNRGGMLRKVIASYRRQSVPVEIFVHDNGSDDSRTIEILRDLEREGITVFRRAPIRSADELNNVSETLDTIFSHRSKRPYIVTDCDVDLSDAHQEAVATYITLLNTFSFLECVGPMLRIDDVRKSFPLFGRVMNLHIQQFWGQQPQIIELGKSQVAYIRAQIDTTFAVHRSGERFRRLKMGARVYAPFAARHLDWYPHENSTDDESSMLNYRDRSSSEVSHWGNKEYLKEHNVETPRYRSFKVVRLDAQGRVEIMEQLVSSNPL